MMKRPLEQILEFLFAGDDESDRLEIWDRNADVPQRSLLNHLFNALLPVLAVAAIMGAVYRGVTTPVAQISSDVVEMGIGGKGEAD